LAPFASVEKPTTSPRLLIPTPNAEGTFPIGIAWNVPRRMAKACVGCMVSPKPNGARDVRGVVDPEERGREVGTRCADRVERPVVQHEVALEGHAVRGAEVVADDRPLAVDAARRASSFRWRADGRSAD
jgi:hypothetical protein